MISLVPSAGWWGQQGGGSEWLGLGVLHPPTSGGVPIEVGRLTDQDRYILRSSMTSPLPQGVLPAGKLLHVIIPG